MRMCEGAVSSTEYLFAEELFSVLEYPYKRR